MLPNEEMASKVVLSLTNEDVLSCARLTTGDQYFVFAVNTKKAAYVIRMTDEKSRDKFLSAIYWQEKLLPLGVPLAKFIQSDLYGKYSPFPSLLMHRLPGNDLCNIYTHLSPTEKQNLANEMIRIQAMTEVLPRGNSYGIHESYEQSTADKTWFDFIFNRLQRFKTLIKEAAIFDVTKVEDVMSVAIQLKNDFSSVLPSPFLWDASERNVIVYQGKISGIVDVDDMCFGDPLFVIGLTATALENEGYDTLYPDYWAAGLNLSRAEQLRLTFYRLFFTIVFMRKQSMITTNNQIITYNTERLNKLFEVNLARVNKQWN